MNKQLFKNLLGSLSSIRGRLTLATLISCPLCSGLTFVVVNTNDSGPGSLRQAILESNAFPATPNTIDFWLGPGEHVIRLASTLTITSDVTINGPGAQLLTILGQQCFDIFYIPLGQTTTFSGLTIAGGLNGIEANGTINVNSSVFIANALSGIALDLGTTATICYSTFAGNWTGVYLDVAGSAMIFDSTFNCNMTGMSANQASTLRLTNSTVAQNGSGLVGNTAATLIVNDSTINSNRNGGITTAPGDTLIIGNTIVALDCGGDVQGDGTVIDEGHNLIGNGDGSAFAALNGVNGDIVGTSAHPVDPRLGPLADNGGPTETEALLPGSPAINAGNNAIIPPGITTDQRGPGYPRIRDYIVDIGAYEADISSCQRQSSAGW